MTTNNELGDRKETTSENRPEDVDKELPLRDDIRLLGRLLGDTLREQEGEDVFNLIERIRQDRGSFPSLG